MSTTYAEPTLEGSGTYETVKETTADPAAFVQRWLAEIELSSKEEKTWREEAQEARNIYRCEKEGEKRRFNILYANTETECGVLYNSTPIPDVRPRDLDPDEKARLAGQTIERALNFAVDSYDLDTTMDVIIHDARLVGRGVGRVRYCPYEYQGQIYEDVCCEHVPWKHFRRGPANSWDNIPWVAFELFLTRDQLMQLAPDIGGSVNLDFELVDSVDVHKPDAPPNVFKRARVWEIWDRQTRKVIFIAPGNPSKPLRVEDDPLGLVNFLPCPEPLYTVRTSDSLVPVCPYRVIRPMAEELEEVTLRIQALVRIAKWRGFSHPAFPSFERMEEAQDGELIPASEDLLGLVQAGGLDKFVFLMPIGELLPLIQGLSQRADQIKQTIYEVQGISDVMRAATDPDETYGAQALKATVGSNRIRRSQKAVQRFVRDLFRLKAEIICNIFDPNNLQMMTRMAQPSRLMVQMAQMQLQRMQQMQAQLPPPQPQGPPQGAPSQPPQAPGQQMVPSQAPQPPAVNPDQLEQLQKIADAVAWEDIVELLRSGVGRLYRIDIETDSTVRGDLREEQANAAQFVQGTAGFVQAFAPILQSGMIPGDVVVDLYTSFARFFKLGKQGEDALARLSQAAAESSKNPQQKPDPEQTKIEGQKMIEQMRLDAKAQADQAHVQAQAALKDKELQNQVQLQNAQLQHQAQIEQIRAQSQEAIDRNRLSAQLEHELKKFNATHGLERDRLDFERQKHANELGLKQDQMLINAATTEQGAGAANGKGKNPVRQPGIFSGLMDKHAETSAALAASIAHALGEMAQHRREQAVQQAEMMKLLSAPRRVNLIKDRTGRAIGATHEVVPPDQVH